VFVGHRVVGGDAVTSVVEVAVLGRSVEVSLLDVFFAAWSQVPIRNVLL